MVQDIRWGIPSDGHTFPIYAGPADDLDRVAEFADERGMTHIRFGGDTWTLSADDSSEACAQTGTGVWTVTANKEKFARADRYDIQADRHALSIIVESKHNYVIDIDGQKAGQFTSQNRGLRNLHVQFEGPGEKLPLDVQIFVTWVARRCMESRVVNTTWAWTIALLLSIPLALAYWIGLI